MPLLSAKAHGAPSILLPETPRREARRQTRLPPRDVLPIGVLGPDGDAVVCCAHVANQTARIEGDCGTGEAGGSRDLPRLVCAAARAWRCR
jgi:hypothetical protein